MASKTVMKVESAAQTENRVLREQVGTLLGQNDRMAEGLAQVDAMFAREDRGWKTMFASAEENGMSLDELKEWSVEIKNAQVGAPWIKRGLSLRTSYVWQSGIQYANIPKEGRGKGTNVQALIAKPLNKRNFFGSPARARREGSLYADGIAFYIGDNNTKILQPVPLVEITADIRDPDCDHDVWAYRRTWQRYNSKTGQSKTMNEWYYTDTFYDKRPSTIRGIAPSVLGTSGQPEYVSQNHTMFDMVANSVDGFAYGSPDALAALIWSRLGRDAYMDGITMTSAMATFAFKATSTTRTGAENASMKVASAGAGNTAILGATNDLVPMSSAGKGYDYDASRPIIATIASALSVSSVDLTSDPGAAGASYGSASSLNLPTRLAMEARRDEHIEFDQRVLTWMGAKDADVFFKTLTDPQDLYRAQQGVILKMNSGLYEGLEIKSDLEALEGNDTTALKIPDGFMLPNNKLSVNRSDVDTDGNPTGGSNGSAAAVGTSQGSAGSGTPVGSAPNDNSGRTDTLSK